MIPNLLVGFLLLGVAVWLSAKQRAAVRATDRSQLTEQEDGFFRRQVRRRRKMNVMLGIVGCAIAGSPWIPGGNLVLAAYWMATAILMLWCSLLALLDIANLRAYFHRLENQQLAAHATWARHKRKSENEATETPKEEE